MNKYVPQEAEGRGTTLMISDLYDSIINGINVKANILQLRDMLRKDQTEASHNIESLLFHINYNCDCICSLLTDSDPKIRKNTALILALLRLQDSLYPLYNAYIKEDTLFVRSSYLTALATLDYSELTAELTERVNQLDLFTFSETERKHVSEEKKLLIDMTEQSAHDAHRFTGFNIESELVLLTNRNFKSVTMAELRGILHKEFTAGVMVKTDKLYDILRLRTYQELLFVPDIRICPADPVEAAALIAKSNIPKFIRARHDNPDKPFYFRVEVKSKDKTTAGEHAKKLGQLIEQKTNCSFINSVSNYEIEFRFIESSDGKYNLLLRFYTLKDKRFEYRREVIAACMKPYIAALVMTLAKPYLSDNAAVLDPFCGVGTMLVERNKILPASVMYGIDIFGEAVKKAEYNMSRAGMTGNYYLINRDFFEFTHEHKFDEIITDMPFVTSQKTDNDIKQLYGMFFIKIKQLLNSNGVIIMYSHNRDLVPALIKKHGYELLQEYEISMMEGSYCYIIRYTV